MTTPPPPFPSPPPPTSKPDSYRAWEWIAAIEGGGQVTITPGDPGGTTKWGFAQRYNPDIDVRSLTFAQAYVRFCARFWGPLQCSSLPYPIALGLVDYAFNAGADDAIPALQRAVGASLDGAIGPRTINATTTLWGHNPRRLLNDFLSYRLLKYAESPRLADNRGWLVRTLALRGALEKEMTP